MGRYLFSLLLVLVGTQVGATPFNAKSAYRHPAHSYVDYKSRASAMTLVDPNAAMYSTPVDDSRPYENANLRAVTAWESTDVLLERFKEMRDERFLTVDSQPTFKRRLSWLLPDDGCYARAQLGIRQIQNRLGDGKEPDKVFVFGDLNVKTENSPSGSVTWWYHVAPIVEVDGVKYVLDPAIDPTGPLPLIDWLARQSETPEKLEVAICHSGTYTPYDSCATENDGMEQMAEREQVWFLDWEWTRLQELNRNPDEELGDRPPWL